MRNWRVKKVLILFTLPVSPFLRVKMPVSFYCPRKVRNYKVLTGLRVRLVFIPLQDLNTLWMSQIHTSRLAVAFLERSSPSRDVRVQVSAVCLTLCLTVLHMTRQEYCLLNSRLLLTWDGYVCYAYMNESCLFHFLNFEFV